MTTLEKHDEAIWVPPAVQFRWDVAEIPGLTPQAEVAIALRCLYYLGYCEHSFGQLTWRQPDGTYLTNAYEVTWDTVRASQVLRIDEYGEKVGDNPPLNPNAGLTIHSSLRHHVDSERTGCVVHAHPIYGRYWTIIGRPPPIYDQGSAVLPDDVHFDKVSTELYFNERDAHAIGASGWGLLRRHGVVVTASTLAEAMLRLTVLEHRSKVAWAFYDHPEVEPMSAEEAASFPPTFPPDYPEVRWDMEVRRAVSLDPTVLL